MRIAIGLFFVLFFSACGPSGGKGAVGAGTPPPPPVQPDYVPPYWGALACQKTSTCKNPVLNKVENRLRRFLSRITGSESTGDMAVFTCGRTVEMAWREEFDEAAEDSITGDFLFRMIDPNGCTVRLSLEEYFKSTEEYKNEYLK